MHGIHDEERTRADSLLRGDFDRTTEGSRVGPRDVSRVINLDNGMTSRVHRDQLSRLSTLLI
jgi:hypothetical protein